MTLVKKPQVKKPAKKKRKPADPVAAWVSRLRRYRPNLADDTLAALSSMYGVPVWERVHDPTSELILTILSANSADINAENRRCHGRRACVSWPAE